MSADEDSIPMATCCREDGSLREATWQMPRGHCKYSGPLRGASRTRNGHSVDDYEMLVFLNVLKQVNLLAKKMELKQK